MSFLSSRRRILTISLLASTLGLTMLEAAAAAEPAIIYLTRHAERAGEADKDPDLTPQGHARARQIAAILRTAGIAHIFSTPTRRTRATAQPLASSLGLEVQSYDPAQPAKLAAQVRGLTGATLVVGHSNTVGELVTQFGGKPGAPIGDMEYDRLYQLITAPDGTVTTVLLHSTI